MSTGILIGQACASIHALPEQNSFLHKHIESTSWLWLQALIVKPDEKKLPPLSCLLVSGVPEPAFKQVRHNATTRFFSSLV
jgi:hypothetical protein